MSDHVLIVDDDPLIRRFVELTLKAEGFETELANDGASAIEAFKSNPPRAVVLDLGLPDMDGKVVLEALRAAPDSEEARQADVPVVVLTGSTRVEDAVACMQLGATDYVSKPCDPTRLVTSVRNAWTQSALLRTVSHLSDRLRASEGSGKLLGESPAMDKVRSLLARAWASDVPVLLLGESGTGKEVAARVIHSEGQRNTGPFVALNCSAIPEALLESELFGHVKGAFTGASADKPGRFEQAASGTLFLDEIGELRPDLQVKLLRVLQERRVQRLGDTRDRAVDVRVVAATNRDLKAGIAEGAFREDLYYRLAVFPVVLPPLRERGADVELLARTFLARYAERHKRPARDLSQKTLEVLARHPWPGNVRELENVIERAVLLEDGATLTLESLSDEVLHSTFDATEVPEDVAAPGPPPGGADERILTFEEEERRIFARALRLVGWNVREAAAQLGIGRATLYRKIERYGLRRDT